MGRLMTLAALFAMLAAVRISAPSDLLEGDQAKQVGYVMDILEHGHWVVQHEVNGQIATKPPLYNWLAAGTCTLFGTRSEWAMKLPSLLAGAGFLACLYQIGTAWFDRRVGYYACMACLASHHFAKLFWFARTDMLMAFTVLAACVLLIRMRAGAFKSLCIGLVLAASVLTKGPVGPAMYGAFALVWLAREGKLRDPQAYLGGIPGLLICLLASGVYVAAAAADPQFLHRVIYWQLGERMADEHLAKPFWYYLPHLFTRIAPWPVLAAAAVFLQRGSFERRQSYALAAWAGLGLLLLSVVPVKRHDHLLPVYPPVFLLAGTALRELCEPVFSLESRGWLGAWFAALLAAPAALAWSPQPVVVGLISVCFASGLLAAVCYARGWRVAVPIAAAGLIAAQGVYHHEFHREGRPSYARLQSFVAEVRALTHDSPRVLVFQAHPLIAYELNQHVRLDNLEQLASETPRWVIAPAAWKAEIETRLAWVLVPQAQVRLEPREHEATLFRVAERRLAERTNENDARR